MINYFENTGIAGMKKEPKKKGSHGNRMDVLAHVGYVSTYPYLLLYYICMYVCMYTYVCMYVCIIQSSRRFCRAAY